MNWDEVDYTVELRGLYDGWSFAVMKDGTAINRWSKEDGTGPTPGYERRWAATQKAIAEWSKP